MYKPHVIVKDRSPDDGLPKGVSREYSPLWNFPDKPYTLLSAVLRYAHILQSVQTLADVIYSDGAYDGPLEILDIGCGMGEMARFLEDGLDVQRNYRGFDVDPWKISHAKRILGHIPWAHFHNLDITEMGEFPRSHIAICTEVIEHLEPLDGTMLLTSLSTHCEYLIGTIPQPTYHRKVEWHQNEIPTDEAINLLRTAGWDILYRGGMYKTDNPFHKPYAKWASPKVLQQVAGILYPSVIVPNSGGEVTYFICQSKELRYGNKS